jgi:hypothetical protein
LSNHCLVPGLRTTGANPSLPLMSLGVGNDNLPFTFTFLPLLFSLTSSVSFLFHLLYSSFLSFYPFASLTLLLSISPVSVRFIYLLFLTIFSLPVFNHLCMSRCQRRWMHETQVRDSQAICIHSQHGWLERPCGGLIPIQGILPHVLISI